MTETPPVSASSEPEKVSPPSRVPLTPLPANPTPVEREFAQLEQRVLEHVFTLEPVPAVFLGLHGFDGVLPDFSAGATSAWIDGANALLDAVDAVPARGLPALRRLDIDRLRFLLQTGLFHLLDSRQPEREPASYLFGLELEVYMAQDYAPKEERVRAMIRLLEATPAFLQTARDRLRGPLPLPFLTLGIDMASGLPAHYSQCQEFVGSSPAALAREFRKARQTAEQAAAEFLTFLRAELPRAVPDFALGPVRLQKLLLVTEGLSTPWEVLLDDAWQDLRRNQRRLAEIGRALSPPRGPAELIRALREDRTPPEGVLDEARAAVEETRALILEKKFVSLPNEVPCRVEPMPPMDRAFAFAMMGAPGPFEPHPESSVYYISPLEPSWDPARRDQWLAFFNRASLGIITAHETYPGHHVQALHLRSQTLSSVARVSDSSFVEGWAHYTEQLVIEQGFRKGQVNVEVAQLREALLRDCRMIASLSMHGLGMPLADAEQLFQREGFTEPAVAQLEARRGTFNPTYYSYTLGKRAILRVRDRYFRERPNGTLLDFHDRILSNGNPPVGLLERLVLENGTSAAP